MLTAPTSAPRFSALGQRVQPPTIARLMTMALENPGLLSLAAGFTDHATLPVEEVSVVTAELARGQPDFLQYGGNAGHTQLREALAGRLQRAEPTLDDAELLAGCFITNGSQQALYLAMQVLCDPGDIVLVDRPSYFVFLEMLTGLGVEARSLPVNIHGKLDPEALRLRLRAWRRDGDLARIKAVYFVSYFSNPSGRTLSLGEKEDLGRVLREEGVVVPVVEDAAYRELGFTATVPPPSVFTVPSWAPFPKLYLSTLTKPYATGLKVGYGICSDADWLARMLHVKGHHDFGTANFNQAMLARVLLSGGFDEQLKRIRPRYLRKMTALHEALAGAGLRELGWKWSVPEGGLYLWLEAPIAWQTGLDSVFCRRCIEAGVLYVPGELCFGDEPPRNGVRLSFGVLMEADLREAARRFAGVVRALAQR